MTLKLAWLFPGQGSQAVGMGRDLYRGSAAARETLDLADATLGFPLTRLMFEGPAAVLELTVNAQPAIVATSLAALAALREAWRGERADEPPAPAFVAGHSVGEYAALVASGAADPATGLRLVRARAVAMHAAGTVQPGGMTAVLGLRREAVEEACRQAREQAPGSYVAVANHNSETQVAIAGDEEGLRVAAQLCLAAGARRCVKLPVSAAFHSAAMEPAAAALESAVREADLVDAHVPLVANVTARPIVAVDEARRELVTQLARPVLWSDTIETMADAGVTTFVEFGHGKVLTNLLTRREPAPEAISVGDSAGVGAAVDWLARRAAI